MRRPRTGIGRRPDPHPASSPGGAGIPPSQTPPRGSGHYAGVTRIAAERHLPGSTPADAAALWWDTTRWPSFVDGFSHVHKREGDWPAVGGRLVWDARPGSDRGRVIERVLD